MNFSGTSYPLKNHQTAILTTRTPKEQLLTLRYHINTFYAETSHYWSDKKEKRLYFFLMLTVNKIWTIHESA